MPFWESRKLNWVNWKNQNNCSMCCIIALGTCLCKLAFACFKILILRPASVKAGLNTLYTYRKKAQIIIPFSLEVKQKRNKTKLQNQPTKQKNPTKKQTKNPAISHCHVRQVYSRKCWEMGKNNFILRKLCDTT